MPIIFWNSPNLVFLQRYVFQLFNNAFLTVTINCFFWVWVYSVWVYMSMKWGHYALGYNVIMSHQRSGIILESPFRPRQGEETVTPVHPQGRVEAWTLNIAVNTKHKITPLFFITILGVCIKLTMSILTKWLDLTPWASCGSLSLRTWQCRHCPGASCACHVILLIMLTSCPRLTSSVIYQTQTLLISSGPGVICSCSQANKMTLCSDRPIRGLKSEDDQLGSKQ